MTARLLASTQMVLLIAASTILGCATSHPVGPAAPQASKSSGPVRDIEVLVRDEKDQPMASASLVVSRAGEEWLSEIEVPANVVGTTDTAGRATLRDVASEFRFVAAVQQGVGASAFRAVSDRGRVQLTLATCDAEVRGHVVDHHGKGVAGVEVVLLERLQHRDYVVLHRPEPKTLPVSRRTVSGADGSFRFRTSRSWNGCLVWPDVGRLRWGPGFLSFVEADDLRLEMPGRAVVRGIALDWRGEPVPGCEVWAGEPGFALHFDTSTGSLVTADAEGRFEIPFMKAGRYVVVPLGTSTVPAGTTVDIELTEDRPGSIELRTAEPARIAGSLLGGRNRPVRIVAQPGEYEDARAREITSIRDGEFELGNLMRGMNYRVIAYQDGVEIARCWAKAGDGRQITLRNENAGDRVLVCHLCGDGLHALAGRQVRIAVHPVDDRTLEPKLRASVTEVEWRGETELRFDDLPRRSPAVAVLLVDGGEYARSEPFELGEEPVITVIEVRAEGVIDVETLRGKPDWCAIVRRADGAAMVGRESKTWQSADEAFRCRLPAGEYVLQVGYNGAFGMKEARITVVAGRTKRYEWP